MKCSVRLDKKSMIQALGSDEITINNIRYLVPEEQLLHCLVNGIYGEIDLEFEEITSIKYNGLAMCSADIKTTKTLN